ncbi:DNA polymerase IV (plasmid) [Oscillospiraceae bacterium PP1C4]
MDKVILHIDQNNFYASVECLYNPELRDKPVAVGGDVEQRHGIVLAKNMLAKKCGVQTGEPLWQARQKCPGIIFVPPHFNRYLRFSRLAKEIYDQYTDCVESFGLDECWLDVTGSSQFGTGKEIADELRRRVTFELGLTASVGVSFNKIFAKLGSDYKKPDATTVITRENYKDIVWPLPASDLLYVGRATDAKLHRYGIDTIGDLAKTDPSLLERWLGKNGIMIWRFANGDDHSPVSTTEDTVPIKSIGNSTTTPRDLVTDEDVRITMTVLCESVAARLRDQRVNCSTVQISIRDSELFSYERQGKLEIPTCVCEPILQKAFDLYKAQHTNGKPIRSIGVRACNLTSKDFMQLSIFPEQIRQQKLNDLECAVDDVRRRYGNFAVRRGNTLLDTGLSNLDPKKDHTIHPVAFLQGGN